MKKIALSFIVATSVLCATEFNPDTTDTETYITNQNVVNEIIGGNDKINLINSDKDMSLGGEVINAGDVTIVNIPFNYALDSEFMFEANLPVVSNKDFITDETNTGLGDISFGGSYNNGSASSKRGQNITTIRYKSTTGDAEKGLGSLSSSMSVTHRVIKDYSEEIQFNGLFSYTFNNAGNSSMMMFGASKPCELSDKLTTSAKVVYNHIDASYASLEVDSLDLWIGWSSDKLIKKQPIGFGFKLPILNQKDGSDVDKTVLFYLSASTFFDK